MIHLAAALVYGAAFVLWIRALMAGTKGNAVRVPAFVATLGVGIHLFALARYTAEFGALPLVGMAPSLSTLSLLIGVALVATLAIGEAGRVAILLLPLMILLQGIALVMRIRPAEATVDIRGSWLVLHVALGFAAVAAMAIAGAAGALYVAQFREIKSKRLGKLFKFLPPLATLDRLGRTSALLAFPALTVAILLAWAWMRAFPSTDGRSSTPEIVWAIFAWAVILAVLVTNAGRGRGERRTAVAGMVGFALIAASYVFVRALAGTGALFL